MKVPIRIGIFATFIFVLVLSLSLLVFWITARIQPNYLKLVEENLVDTSRVLAAIISEDMNEEGVTAENMRKAFDRIYHQPFNSRIYEVSKRSIDLQVYVTDDKGMVLYHSRNPAFVSTDFSNWRNIHRTMRGEYGARATREDPSDPRSLNLHVSAPIFVDGQFAGVLTVAKPITWAYYFMQEAKDEIIFASIAAGIVATILSLLMSAWLLRPISRLTRFAQRVAAGNRTPLPRLGHARELQEMGQAIESMHNALEGRQYVEKYIQSLAHEIKSPVSAITGAAELINEGMPPAKRAAFLENIREESRRITRIVDQLLELSAVEKLHHLEKTSRIDLVTLLKQVLHTFEGNLAAHHLSVNSQHPEKATIKGDTFLITRAISNVLQNAIDFSPEGSPILISINVSESNVCMVISDEGPGIPDFALDKIFDRFYSMPRPRTKRKSSGLGLAFAKEIMELHDGSIHAGKNPNGGASITMKMPRD